MATIAGLGAGMNGLTTAMLLARDGHEVTVLERDPAAPPPRGRRRGTTWERRGVSQFRLPHFMLPRWWRGDAGGAAGGARRARRRRRPRFNVIARCPRSGAVRCATDDDAVRDGHRPPTGARGGAGARWPQRTPGLNVRRGVAVTGFVTGAPTAPGCRTSPGCSPRTAARCRRPRRRLPAAAAPAGRLAAPRRRPAAASRSARTRASSTTAGISGPRTARCPPALAPLLQHYDSVHPASRCRPTTAPGRSG